MQLPRASAVRPRLPLLVVMSTNPRGLKHASITWPRQFTSDQLCDRVFYLNRSSTQKSFFGMNVSRILWTGPGLQSCNVNQYPAKCSATDMRLAFVRFLQDYRKLAAYEVSLNRACCLFFGEAGRTGTVRLLRLHLPAQRSAFLLTLIGHGFRPRINKFMAEETLPREVTAACQAAVSKQSKLQLSAQGAVISKPVAEPVGVEDARSSRMP